MISGFIRLGIVVAWYAATVPPVIALALAAWVFGGRDDD